MGKLTPYEVFCIYRGMKLHFTGKYDYVKYGPLKRVTQQAFERKPERAYCYKISTLYSDDNVPKLFISGFIQNTDYWIQDFMGDVGRDRLLKYQNIQQNFSYVFRTEMDNLFRTYGVLDCIKYKGLNPPILDMYYSGRFSLQSLVAFDRKANIFSYLEKHLAFDPIWKKTRFVAGKFSPFFKTDEKKLGGIIKELMQDHLNTDTV